MLQAMGNCSISFCAWDEVVLEWGETSCLGILYPLVILLLGESSPFTEYDYLWFEEEWNGDISL